ncbi:MAG: MOSC domain-containing protein [Pseudomonadota bacterium]
MTGRIVALARYPIKGMSAEPLDSVTLQPGEGFPGDRQWGFARPESGFDPYDPKPLPKDKFVVLLKEAGLAAIEARLDKQALFLTHAGSTQTFDLSHREGRDGAAQFLESTLKLDKTPSLVRSDPHRFTDVSVVSPELMNAVSILSRDSVGAFSKDIGQPINEKRFRMNIEVEGWTPWVELNHVGRDIRIGTVRLKVLLRTRRCAATEVNPETAERDLPLPSLLRKTYAHFDMGVYAEVVEGGTIKLGDTISI